MKFSIIFLGVFALTLAVPVPEDNSNVLSPAAIPLDKELSLQLSKDFVEQFMEVSANKNLKSMQAVLNDYLDKFFNNFESLAIHKGLDPMSMPEIHEKVHALLASGTLDLTNGWLQGLASMHRGGDVIVDYDSVGTNVVGVVIPIEFGVLAFNYDYCAKFMHLGPCGGLEGKITNVQVEIAVSFDFNKYQAALGHFTIKNSGHIDMNFSGHVLTDWILNLFIDVATTALHRIILIIMESLIKNPVKSVVDLINEVLNAILHPATPTTTVASYLVG